MAPPCTRRAGAGPVGLASVATGRPAAVSGTCGLLDVMPPARQESAAAHVDPRAMASWCRAGEPCQAVIFIGVVESSRLGHPW